MRFEQCIAINRSACDVWSFFEDLENLPRWDRGVARVERTSPGAGVGATFNTYAKGDRGRMSYEVTEFEPCDHFAVVTRSSLFRFAEWRLRLETFEAGTKVTCILTFSLRSRYLPLAAVLWVLSDKAIRTDLIQLRDVVEQSLPA
jgi:hypothetical protein